MTSFIIAPAHYPMPQQTRTPTSHNKVRTALNTKRLKDIDEGFLTYHYLYNNESKQRHRLTFSYAPIYRSRKVFTYTDESGIDKTVLSFKHERICYDLQANITERTWVMVQVTLPNTLESSVGSISTFIMDSQEETFICHGQKEFLIETTDDEIASMVNSMIHDAHHHLMVPMYLTKSRNIEDIQVDLTQNPIPITGEYVDNADVAVDIYKRIIGAGTDVHHSIYGSTVSMVNNLNLSENNRITFTFTYYEDVEERYDKTFMVNLIVDDGCIHADFACEATDEAWSKDYPLVGPSYDYFTILDTAISTIFKNIKESINPVDSEDIGKDAS